VQNATPGRDSPYAAPVSNGIAIATDDGIGES
jgi:hypothetical protein